MTHEHEIAARAALTDLLTYHRTNITRIEHALAALDGDDVAATRVVRPPAPKVIDAPVVLPTPPKREQRPAARRGTAPNKGTSKYDLAKVADVAREALRAGKSMGGAVEERLGVNPGMGAYLIGQARKAGHDVPARTVGVRSEPTPEQQHQAEVEHAATRQIFRCATCTAVFSEKSKLSNHTITSHRRGPMQAELVALDDEVAA